MTCALVFEQQLSFSDRCLSGFRNYHRRPHQGDHKQ